MALKYERTQKKKRGEILKAAGSTVIEMWECVFNIRKMEHPGINTYLQTRNGSISPPLDPRDAFLGGETNAIKLYHQVNEEICEQSSGKTFAAHTPGHVTMGRSSPNIT